MLTGLPAEVWQLGVAGLMFVVWYATFKMHVKATENANKTIGDLATKTSASYEKAIEDSQKRNDRLIDLLKEQSQDDRERSKEEQEVKSHLIRILTRMEQKLDQPLRCPAHINAQRQHGD